MRSCGVSGRRENDSIIDRGREQSRPFLWASAMSQRITIAIGQFFLSADPHANGAVIREQMREACARGARLILFPEGALSGYMKAQIACWNNVNWSAIRDEVEEIAKLAGELRLWVVVGCAHHLTGQNLPHNSLYVINDAGSLVGRYDKRKLSPGELAGRYSPGHSNFVFEVDRFRFGCAICLELMFPDIFTEYARLDVDCCLVADYLDHPIHGSFVAYLAAVNGLWIGLASPAQCSRSIPSQWVDPEGIIMSSGPNDGSSRVILTTLDRGDPKYDVALNKRRPWHRQAREGQIYRAAVVQDPRSDDRLNW